MKQGLQAIQNRPIYIKSIEWGRLISITGSSQLLIQAAGFLSGIFVIRLLSTQEYGLYTLGNTMLGTMSLLADGGIGASVYAQGGKAWQDREELGSVLASGFYLRKKFAVVSLLIAIPVLFYLLRHHNAGWLTSILILSSLIPAFFATLSGSLLNVGPLLHQAIGSTQKIQIGVSLGRLLMTLLTLFIFPWAFVAILSAGLPQIWGNIRLKRISNIYADWNQKPDLKIQKKILDTVKRILPGSVYYCLSGQITVWLISIFGNTAAIAQVGALGRLSMILSLFSSVFSTLVVPRFARLPTDKGLVFKRYLQILTVLIMAFASITLVVSMFPSQLLWVLGKNYSGLEKELILSVAGSCMALFAGLLFTIGISRNWVINPLILIPLNLTAIISSACIIDVSSLQGILKLNLFVSCTEVLIYLIYGIIRIDKVSVNNS